MLNAAASLAGKTAGQQLALDMAGDWKERVLSELRAWCAIQRAQGRAEMTMEQFRAVATEQPSSHKAWGALPLIACKAGILAPMTHPDGSPMVQPAESVRTHGHYVRRWALASFASASANGGSTGSLHHRAPVEAARQPLAIGGVGHPASAVREAA